ncbi:hypothetical protein ACFQPF_13605 [Fictibacillus iocasae]|uniref:Sporulation protein n=1 Tax=Fictibacillus iocasae TaxID=2715437 RepID=A0ABW2NQE8_9BACL
MRMVFLIVISFMITACSPQRTVNDKPTSMMRNYYQVKQTAENSDMPLTDIEQIKRHAVSLPFVSQAAVIKKKDRYEVGLKLRTYDRKIHNKICLEVKENLESQWNSKADVYSSPAKFRELRKQMKKQQKK